MMNDECDGGWHGLSDPTSTEFQNFRCCHHATMIVICPQQNRLRLEPSNCICAQSLPSGYPPHTIPKCGTLHSAKKGETGVSAMIISWGLSWVITDKVGLREEPKKICVFCFQSIYLPKQMPVFLCRAGVYVIQRPRRAGARHPCIF